MKIPFTNIEIGTRKEIANVADEKSTKEDRPTAYIKYPEQLPRLTQDINKWRLGLRMAESIRNPNRRSLYTTYQDVVLDNHLSGLMQARKNKILGKDFIIVNDAGEEQPELTKIFQATWFRKFLSIALDTPYYGFSLIQLGDIIEGKFSDVELVRREYVSPEFGIVSSTPGSNIGRSYLEAPWANWCVPVGDKRDLGLLVKAAPIVIWKKNAMGAWAEYTEVFGSPMRIGKTDARDAASRKNMIDMFENAGSAPWMVIDKDDEVEFAQVSRTDAYQVYDKLVERSNSELSKLILGQTGTTDEKTYSGSAEIHADVSEEFAHNDESLVCSVIKDKLFPVMNFHGFGLENSYPKFRDSDKYKAKDKILIDEKLMKFGYQPDQEYIEKTYDTPGDYKKEPAPTNLGAKTIDKLKNLYE